MSPDPIIDPSDAVGFREGLVTGAKSAIDVIDGCDRVASLEQDPDNAFLAGVLMLRDEAVRDLERLGFTSLEPLGQEFEPNLHESLGREGEGECVIHVVRRGWRAPDGSLLRAAQVILGPSPTPIPTQARKPAGTRPSGLFHGPPSEQRRRRSR